MLMPANDGVGRSVLKDADTVFAGSIPALYDRYLGPLIFEPYAADLAERLRDFGEQRVLETACGTGIVSRALAGALPERASIVATDLNQSMLDFAAARFLGGFASGGVGVLGQLVQPVVQRSIEITNSLKQAERDQCVDGRREAHGAAT